MLAFSLKNLQGSYENGSARRGIIRINLFLTTHDSL